MKNILLLVQARYSQHRKDRRRTVRDPEIYAEMLAKNGYNAAVFSDINDIKKAIRTGRLLPSDIDAIVTSDVLSCIAEERVLKIMGKEAPVDVIAFRYDKLFQRIFADTPIIAFSFIHYTDIAIQDMNVNQFVLLYRGRDTEYTFSRVIEVLKSYFPTPPGSEGKVTKFIRPLTRPNL